MQIDKTYQKKKVIDPRWWLLLAFIIIFIVLKIQDCSGQIVELSQRWDACEDYETAIISANLPNNVHSISWEVFFNSQALQFESIGFNDVFTKYWVGVSLVWNLMPNSIRISWVSVFEPLGQADTLISLVFHKLTNSDLEWSVDPNYCEITDKDGIVIPTTYLNGWLRCYTTGIKEFSKSELTRKTRKFNILGQEL